MEFFISLLATRLNEASVYMSTWCMVNNKAQQKIQAYLKVYYKKILHFVAACNIIRE